MTLSAVHQQRDAAECLEMILNKVSPHVSEVSTCSDQVPLEGLFLIRVTEKYIYLIDLIGAIRFFVES